MATFKKGESMKNQRLVVSAVFDQKGKNYTGKNVAFSIANDTKTVEDAMTDPMLVYDTYTDKDGNKQNSYMAGYSKDQWEAIEAAANKEGDAMVINADVIPRGKGRKGLAVNTKTLSTPEEGFSKAKHDEVTTQARQEKAKAREAAASAKEASAEVEEELEQ